MPTITSISPASGSQFTPVVITGSGFLNVGPLDVTFGGVSTTFTINSDTQITAIAPGGTGTVPVVVRALLDGISNSMNFTYTTPTLPPILLAIFPAAAAVGATVTLTGTGLSGATAVNFGATPATILTNTATQITVTVPAGAGLVPVTVVTPTGTSNPLGFLYL